MASLRTSGGIESRFAAYVDRLGPALGHADRSARVAPGRVGAAHQSLHHFVAGIQSPLTVWPPGLEPLPPKPWSGTGRPPKLLRCVPPA